MFNEKKRAYTRKKGANMDTASLLEKFSIPGTLVATKANHQGHINSTYVCTFNDQGTQTKYTLQRINSVVFPHPEEVMENIMLVTNHIKSKIAGLPDKDQRCLTVISAKDGKPYVIDDEGGYWRAYRYIEHVATYDTISDASKAYQLGEAIGRFQNQLSDFDSQKLHVTIPNFHNMGWRYTQLTEAATKDCKNRLSSVQLEYNFLMENRTRGLSLWEGMESGRFPTRVTHNDTKMNNVLFSEDGTEALCVIDLDTVMPGTILFDTGDMIRTATNTACEDEKDLSKVHCNVELFASLLKGYRSQADRFLTKEESSMLVESGRVTTQIMAVRFLSDYLSGDVYYHIDRPEHNLDRARTQIALMRSMDSEWERLKSL